MRKYIFLLISIAVISCSPVRKYKSLQQVLDWEKDIQKFEQLDKSETYPEDAVLFSGSSSIKFWSSIKKDMAPYSIIQRGYGGARLSDFAIYAGRIFDPHQCKAIVIFVANDIIGYDDDKSPKEVLGLFRNVLHTIRKTHPNTPVFWISITPTGSRWKVWPEIVKANDLIKEFCSQKKNTYFIPTDFAFLNEKGLPREELFNSDSLHLNQKGYAIWSEIIKKELNKVIGTPKI